MEALQMKKGTAANENLHGSKSEEARQEIERGTAANFSAYKGV